MMQSMAFDWTVFGLTLAALVFFGICYALLINWMSKKQVNGQTAYMVVGGVAVALIASIPTFGLFTVSILFSYFAGCGLPMVIEYGMRVHAEQRKDLEAATAIAKEAIEAEEPGDDKQAPDR